MKKVIFSVIISLMILSSHSYTHAQVVVVKSNQGKKVLKVNPNRQNILIVKLNKSRKNHIWNKGHWRWDVLKNKYVWVKGRWKRKKQNRRWISCNWR